MLKERGSVRLLRPSTDCFIATLLCFGSVRQLKGDPNSIADKLFSPDIAIADAHAV